MEIKDYKKMSYHATRIYFKGLSRQERKQLHRELYEDMCTKEIAAILDNIKENCFVCGASLKMTTARYKRRGNSCEECFLQSTIDGNNRIKIENLCKE